MASRLAGHAALPRGVQMTEWVRPVLRVLRDSPLSIFMLAAIAMAVAAVVISMSGME